MIDVKDLRIGNKVQADADHYNQFHGYGEVTQIYKDGFTVDYHYPGKWFVAVPLTPEVLERCGFVKDGEYFYCSKLGIGNIGWVRQGEYCLNGLPIGSRNMKFVHELQNLIFALTGTELKLTL